MQFVVVCGSANEGEDKEPWFGKVIGDDPMKQRLRLSWFVQSGGKFVPETLNNKAPADPAEQWSQQNEAFGRLERIWTDVSRPLFERSWARHQWVRLHVLFHRHCTDISRVCGLSTANIARHAVIGDEAELGRQIGKQLAKNHFRVSHLVHDGDGHIVKGLSEVMEEETDEFKVAVESRGGVPGVEVFLCQVNPAEEATSAKLDGISKLNNFEFNEAGLRVWRAYSVGEGNLIPWARLPMLRDLRATVGEGCLNPAELEYQGGNPDLMSDEETDEENAKTWLVRRPAWWCSKLTKIIDRCQPAFDRQVAESRKLRHVRVMTDQPSRRCIPVDTVDKNI
ncbi:Hypp6686 [Branchiostoma lanceolatum]|uniref:Hypp6686 protein n=1 Tax=Branchiostoma lanceolatum TaxID=7740 RepID=A0A8K0E7D8_BRALA|nr:Hypp6686 [Branchiostoma lanceolatum]